MQAASQSPAMTDSTDSLLEPELRGLADLLPLFEAPDFAFGTWEGGDRRPDGTIHMPYYTLSEGGERFRQAAGPLLLHQFEWPAWSRTPEFQRLDRDPAAIAGASAEQLQQLLTVYFRAERFSDGTLEGAFDRGVLTAILRRAAVLAGG
jgi:hypothetical protein